jgi:hypothetical protein
MQALLSALFTSAVLALSSTQVLVGRGDCVEEWAPANSQAGLSLSAGAVTPWSMLPFLNFSFDFAGGGWQTSFGPSDQQAAIGTVPLQLNLSFAVFIPVDSVTSCISIGIVDSAGTNFGGCPGLKKGWQNISIPLVTASFWSNGRNLSLPLKSLALGTSNPKAPGPGPSGWIGIADVSLLSGAEPGDVPHPIYHLLVQVCTY